MVSKVALAFSFLVVVFTPQGFAAPQVATYEALLHAIRETRAASEARITVAVEQEKVREAWETGKLIQEHILLNKDRANYGERVIRHLSADLGISNTELKYMREFARTYPIGLPGGQLTWAHYKALLAVNDDRQRREIAREAEKNDWSRDTLREEIRRRRLATAEEAVGELPEIKPGPLYTYQVIRLKDRLKIDLGFGIYHDLPEKDAKKFKEGDIVQLTRHLSLVIGDASLGDLYTYSALVTQVVDGDSVPRKTAQEMRAGPSEPTYGSGFQSALSGIGQNPMS